MNLPVTFSLGGSGIYGIDYTASATSATFTAGVTAIDIVITPTEDLVYEDPKTVVLTLQTGPNYSIGGVTLTSATNNLSTAISAMSSLPSTAGPVRRSSPTSAQTRLTSRDDFCVSRGRRG